MSSVINYKYHHEIQPFCCKANSHFITSTIMSYEKDPEMVFKYIIILHAPIPQPTGFVCKQQMCLWDFKVGTFKLVWRHRFMVTTYKEQSKNQFHVKKSSHEKGHVPLRINWSKYKMQKLAWHKTYHSKLNIFWSMFF